MHELVLYIMQFAVRKYICCTQGDAVCKGLCCTQGSALTVCKVPCCTQEFMTFPLEVSEPSGARHFKMIVLSTARIPIGLN